MAKKQDQEPIEAAEAQLDFKTSDGALVDVAVQAPIPRPCRLDTLDGRYGPG